MRHSESSHSEGVHVMAENLTLVKVEDHEGDGSCSACGREGLRWIATLSDGTAVGVECAKRILGFRPVKRSYGWVADFTPIAEHTEGRDWYVLWRLKSGTATRETCNGVVVAMGGLVEEWGRRGWLRKD